MPNTANYIVDFFGDLIWTTTGVERSETIARYLGCSKWTIVEEANFSEDYPFTFRSVYSRRIGNRGIHGNWHML